MIGKVKYLSPGQAKSTQQYPVPSPQDNLTTYVEDQVTYMVPRGEVSV